MITIHDNGSNGNRKMLFVMKFYEYVKKNFVNLLKYNSNLFGSTFLFAFVQE